MAGGIAIGAVTLTVLAMTLWMRSASASSPSAIRKLDLALDGAHTRLDRTPVLSPDGTRILYVANGKLWTRALSEFTSKEVPGSTDAIYPFWSPDGQQLAFVRGFKLWRVSAAGGQPELVGPVPGDMTGSGAGVWTASGNFLVVGSDSNGITEISGQDGSSREILPLDRKVESDFHELSELPGGRGLLFTAHAAQGADTIGLFADGKRRDVLKLPGENLRNPVYDPSGYLLYGRETTRRGVWAVAPLAAVAADQRGPVLPGRRLGELTECRERWHPRDGATCRISPASSSGSIAAAASVRTEQYRARSQTSVRGGRCAFRLTDRGWRSVSPARPEMTSGSTT